MNPNPQNRFTPGCQPGPGRPQGSVGGRARAIQLIDSILAENADELRASLLKEFHRNPLRFWQRYGFPLVPQASLVRVEGSGDAGAVEWVRLSERFPPEALPPAAAVE